MDFRAEARERSLGATEVLSGGEPIDERGGALARPCTSGARGGTRRAPTPDGDAEREHGGDAHTPAQQGTDHDDLLPPRRARRRDAAPQLLARSGGGGGVNFRPRPPPPVRAIGGPDHPSPPPIPPRTPRLEPRPRRCGVA